MGDLCRSRLVVIAWAVALLGACASTGPARPTTNATADATANETNDATEELCRRRIPEVVAMVNDPELGEVSGMAVSRSQPDVIWMHNDSGDAARFFAVGRNGVRRASFEIAGLDATDWEDMAIGPGPGAPDAGDLLFFADVGDNRKQRAEVQVVSVPEPDVAAASASGGPVTIPAASATVRRFRYPDAPHDAETLLVDPRTGDVFVVTKRTKGFSEVFAVPQPQADGGVGEAVEVGRVSLSPLEMLTGGDVRAQADAVALRSYGTVRIYPMAAGVSIPDALADRSCAATAPADPQGEAIAFDTEGAAYLTFTESHGAPARLYRVGS